MKPSHELTTKEFDDINGSNYRGMWLASRAELGHMLSQEPLPTHDGRPGNRGSVVNIGSNLALVSRPGTRKSLDRSPGFIGLLGDSGAVLT